MKSEPVPEDDGRALKTLVGSNFRETVDPDNREYLILFYIPTNSKCQALRPIFESVAESISHNPNIVMAEFDRSKNDVAGLIVEEFPKLVWFGKDKSVPHLEFDGVDNTKGIIKYMRANTEYRWLEPQPKEQYKKKAEKKSEVSDEL